MRLYLPSLAVCCLSNLLLLACASPLAARAPVDAKNLAYELAGRFSLRESGRSFAGRVQWTHSAEGNVVLVQDPLGGGIAQLTEQATLAQMKMSNGEARQAPTAQLLMQELTGIALPVADLARWLTGRTDLAVLRDAFGRTVQFEEGDWRIAYVYDSEASDALPARIEALSKTGLELKLRVESWELLK